MIGYKIIFAKNEFDHIIYAQINSNEMNVSRMSRIN